MPKPGWEKVEFTASESIVAFLEDWRVRRGLKTRASAVRDVLLWAKTALESPGSEPATKADLELLRAWLRTDLAATTHRKTSARRPAGDEPRQARRPD